MLSLILAEAAVEIVPESIRGHPAVASSSRRLGRSPGSTLLDVSWHHAAMGRLGGGRARHRRGRPDIAHFALLAATGTPLYASGGLDVHLHTAGGIAVRVGLGARLPRSQQRFAGLLGDILAGGRGATSADGADGRPLLEARPMGLERLVAEIGPSVTVGMSRAGEPGTFAEAAALLAGGEGEAEAAAAAGRGPEGGDGGGRRAGPCLVVGAFQRGGFSRRTAGLLDRTVSVGSIGLEAHVVVSRALYEYERALAALLGPRP